MENINKSIIYLSILLNSIVECVFVCPDCIKEMEE